MCPALHVAAQCWARSMGAAVPLQELINMLGAWTGIAQRLMLGRLLQADVMMQHCKAVWKGSKASCRNMVHLFSQAVVYNIQGLSAHREAGNSSGHRPLTPKLLKLFAACDREWSAGVGAHQHARGQESAKAHGPVELPSGHGAVR